jgi:hypothetical protein
MGSEPVVWEAHISELTRHDGRWQHVWNAFLNSCTVPSDVESFPGHPRHPEGPQSRACKEAFERCFAEPQPVNDTMKESMRKFSKALGYRRPRQWTLSDGKFQRSHADEEVAVRDGLAGILEGYVGRRGNFFYPPHGYRGWHTNFLDPRGWRLYLVHNVPSGSSSFRYRHPRTGVVRPETRTLHR